MSGQNGACNSYRKVAELDDDHGRVFGAEVGVVIDESEAVRSFIDGRGEVVVGQYALDDGAQLRLIESTGIIRWAQGLAAYQQADGKKQGGNQNIMQRDPAAGCQWQRAALRLVCCLLARHILAGDWSSF